MIADTTSALAWVAAAEGADDEAADHCRTLLARWEASEDHHFAVRGLRWAAGFFARRGDLEGAHACAAALTRIASATGHADALAALAHAIGEIALADGDPVTAAEQLSRAVELHRGLDIPYERAEIELRAGVALVAAGQRERGLERMGDAYRTARKLGARPLATEAAREVAAMGESVTRRLGRRAAADAEGTRLSRREREVVRLVAVGSHQSRDRPGAVPQPAHRGHARAQPAPQARLPVAHGGGEEGRRAGPAGVGPPRIDGAAIRAQGCTGSRQGGFRWRS